MDSWTSLRISMVTIQTNVTKVSTMPLLTVSTHDVPVMQLCTGATVRAWAGLTVKLGAIFRVTIVTRDTPLTEVSLGIVLTDTPS